MAMIKAKVTASDLLAGVRGLFFGASIEVNIHENDANFCVLDVYSSNPDFLVALRKRTAGDLLCGPLLCGPEGSVPIPFRIHDHPTSEIRLPRKEIEVYAAGVSAEVLQTALLMLNKKIGKGNLFHSVDTIQPIGHLGAHRMVHTGHYSASFFTTENDPNLIGLLSLNAQHAPHGIPVSLKYDSLASTPHAGSRELARGERKRLVHIVLFNGSGPRLSTAPTAPRLPPLPCALRAPAGPTPSPGATERPAKRPAKSPPFETSFRSVMEKIVQP